MRKQITNTVLMIRPKAVRSNEHTLNSNFFQKKEIGLGPEVIQQKALEEFDNFVEVIKAAGIRVIVVEDTDEPVTPDAHFSNNWISLHQNGDVAIYPMMAENRRKERREDLLDILEESGFRIENVIDYSSAEEEEIYLESTGCMILDRVHRKAYCSISPRADEDLFIEFCEDFEYSPVLFHGFQSVDSERVPIYHTNVMMSINEDFAMVCLNAIDDKKERKNLVSHLKSSQKQLLNLTEAQIHNFAGNTLTLEGANKQRFMVMSDQAFDSLRTDQVKVIENYCTILKSPLNTIEKCGGGSIRCMITEVFLPEIS